MTILIYLLALSVAAVLLGTFYGLVDWAMTKGGIPIIRHWRVRIYMKRQLQEQAAVEAQRRRLKVIAGGVR